MEASQLIEINLGLPPSTNALTVNDRASGRRSSPKYIQWREENGWRINEQRPKWPCRRMPANAWYFVVVLLPLDAPGDADNRLKAVHDLLHTMGITPDDKWLWGGVYIRTADVKEGTCVVRVMPADEVRYHFAGWSPTGKRTIS